MGFDKSIKISDWASGYANAVSAKVGGERFWPASDDMPLEIEKCERILRSFTVEGIPQKEEREERVQDGKGNWITKKRKVLRKIPPSAIKNAKGVCIYSSMRSGIAPFGGGGGAGLVLVRLPDGSWSAPSAISPNNLSTGLLLGVDFIDAVLLINSDQALSSFLSHKFTIGAETGLTAGPWGTGASAEAGLERAPIYSYVRTRGAYAGVEIMGQVFLHRFDENERFYYWPGIKAEDILTGKVRMPPLVYPLHRALRDAELGVAQGGKLERVVYDVVKMPESEVMKMLGPNQAGQSKRFVAQSATNSPAPSTPREEGAPVENGNAGDEGTVDGGEKAQNERPTVEEEEEDMVREGEKLRLPPTPQELEMLEQAGIPDDEDLRFAQEERERVYQLPPPPMHVHVQRYWRIRPELATKRPTKQLTMDGPHSQEVREAQYVPLPHSPRSPDPLPELREEVAAGSDHGVLLEYVGEEEADVLMAVAAQGGDVQGLEESGELDQLVAKSPPDTLAHASTEVADAEPATLDIPSEDPSSSSRASTSNDDAGDKTSSSPRPSLDHAATSASGKTDKSAPGRPPRTRPPRRKKAG